LHTRGHAAASQWSDASSPAGVGLEHGKRTTEVPQELGRVLLLLLGNSRLEIPGYQLQALPAHSSGRERKQRVHPRYRQAKETKCGETAVGCRNALIVPLKLGNSPWRTQWRKAKRRPAESIEGNMLNTSRFLHMSTSIDRIASGTTWMAKLLVEEPDALMRARPGLWEPWEGNDPGPPGPRAVAHKLVATI